MFCSSRSVIAGIVPRIGAAGATGAIASFYIRDRLAIGWRFPPIRATSIYRFLVKVLGLLGSQGAGAREMSWQGHKGWRSLGLGLLAMGWAIALGVLPGSSALSTSSESWQYAEFIQAVEADQVERVEIRSDRAQLWGVTRSGETFTVTLQDDPALIDTLTSNDVEIDVQPQRNRSFGNIHFPVFLIPILIVLSLLLTALWVWMLVDCLVNEPSEGNQKLVWVIVIIFTNWLGALIYLFFRRPQRQREQGR